MKITFTRELTLQKADAYLEIEKKVIRKDIQDYLNGKHFKNPLIESRVKKYLQEIGVFNSASFLTRKGEEIKKTGETYEVEKGKYTIWYIENDFVLGTKILFFSRKDATTNPKKENIAPFSVDFTNEEQLLLPTLDGKTDFSKFNLRKQTFFAKIHSPDKLFFKWVWNGLDSSYYEFQGKLGYNEIRAMNISCDKNLEEEVVFYFNDWDPENQRFKSNFISLEQEEKRTFFSDLQGKHSGYDIKLEQIPIMPENKNIATKWRNWLLEQIVKEKHLTATEFEYESMCIQQKEGLAMYNLETPQVSNFIKERSENKLIKWHLQAPEDLNPNKEFFLSSKVIEIPQNSPFSFNDFTSQLEVKTGDVVIYYDYYALKRPDLVEKLLDKFNNIPKKIIVSQPFATEGMLSQFIHINQETYQRCRSKFKIFPLEEKDEQRLHDRYLIIRKEGKWHILNGSNSLNGYIGKEDKNKGLYTTKASVMYAYVKENMLTENTINFLNKIANE